MPVLALFGERGAGKSVALVQEYQSLEAARAETRWVNLGRHQTESQVVTALAATSAAREAGEWWVFLDSVDEGLNVLPALGGLIADWIDSLTGDQRSSMRLRFSCRTGRWPDVLQDTLTRHWKAPLQVRHMILATLSDDDVSVAAEDYGLDADAFCSVLRERGLTQLSKTPVTLLQLLEYHRVNGTLPATAADAYQQACVLLCSETRRPADIRELRAQPTGQRLLPVSARVAAAMQFGAHNVLSDTSPQSFGRGEITLAELEGGHEPGLLDGQAPCTTDELRRLTESHLLEPVGLLRWTFTHRSYQEFLAAHYLHAHQVDPRAQAGLLWVGDGAARHIYPAHREVAAWRSGTDSTLFEDLLRDDPLVLLLADLPARPAADRARVVEAIFNLAQRDDTIDIDRTTLHRLEHPGLPQQLLSRLQPDTDKLVVYMALRVARSCPHPELSDALLQVAETTSLPEELRALALRAIADLHPADVQTVDRIRQLAADDPSPEVVAVAIYRLWPSHLSLRERLDLLRDPAPDYYGHAWVLRSDIPAQLTAAQTAQALLWARDTIQQPLPGRSIVLATSLISRAVTLAGTNGLPGLPHPETLIGEALIALANHRDLRYSVEGRTEHEALGDALRAQHSLRRALTLHLLTHLGERDFLRVWSAVPHGCLTTYDDAFYWMEHWEQLADVPPAPARLLVSITPPTDPDLQSRVEAACRAHPALRQITEGWAPAPEPRQDTDPTPDENRFYSESRLREALAAVHTATPETIRQAWGTVIDQMRCTPDGTEPPRLWEDPLLLWAHHGPSRPSQGSDLDAELRAAARQVLTTVPPLPAPLLAYGGRANPRLMLELSALAVLGTPHELPSATPTHWAGWAIALATTNAYTLPGEAARDAFLPYCAEQAGPALIHLLGEVLRDTHTDAATTHDLARRLGAPTQPDVVDALTVWADHPDRDLPHWQSVTSALAFTGHPSAPARLQAALDLDPSSPATTSETLTRWLVAAQILLHSPALPKLWPLVHKRLHNEVLARAYIGQLGQRPVHHYTKPHQLTGLTEEALAELYLSLAQYVSAETLDPPPRSGWIGEDHFGELIRSIPPLLQARNTPQAAHQLRRLASQTGLWRLRNLAQQTATAAARSLHAPVTPPQLRALAEQSHQRRWVTDEGHLLALVLEALGRFQHVLRRPNGLSIALWNRSESSAAQAEWWPCWEEDLSDILAAFLLQDIGGYRVVVNREVQLDRPGLSGRRTDIQIEVPAPPGSGHDPVRLVIECKGCWNSTLPTALERQLVDRYLDTPRTAGILLTGYFDCDRWTAAKRRSCPATHHTLESVDQHQQQQAHTQQALKGVPVAAFTLDCTLPSQGRRA
ncbi:HEAT repeat domain-containing protein [Streptomyces sp. NPDC050392]|uniref:NACHT domain-containing protein n=1 Tax=Streptomyces sp. NPDC050392 TaxID=3155782 RepID=UPI0034398E68